jgi:hypothetical protein
METANKYRAVRQELLNIGLRLAHGHDGGRNTLLRQHTVRTTNEPSIHQPITHSHGAVGGIDIENEKV